MSLICNRIIKTKDLRAFIKIKPDLYDFRKEANIYDSIHNLEIYPLFCRTRKAGLEGDQLEEVVDWERRLDSFKKIYFTQIWYAYEKARKLSMNYSLHGYRAEEWDFEKNGAFHPKFSLQDENLVLSMLPKVENSYLLKLQPKDEEFRLPRLTTQKSRIG